jgi:putative DNA primase/helicase
MTPSGSGSIMRSDEDLIEIEHLQPARGIAGTDDAKPKGNGKTDGYNLQTADKASFRGVVSQEPGEPSILQGNGDFDSHSRPLDKVWDNPPPKTPNPGEPFIDPNGHRAPATQILFADLESIEPEPVDWIWLHWLARGKLHLLGGAPDAGKTTISLSIAAAISSGGLLPDGTTAPVGNVLIWTSEDDLADTVIPRLTRMGADLKRIKAVYQHRDVSGATRPFNPATDMQSLTEAAKELPGGVALLILDPIVAAVPMTRNSHNAAETRNALQPVIDFCAVTRCAVIGIAHLTKGTAGKDPIERIMGSIAFAGLARVVLLASKNLAEDEVESPRIMVRAKSNIGPSGGGFGYDIDAAALLERSDITATRIVWGEAIEGTARELLNEAEGEQNAKAPKLDQAKRFLEAALAKGERPQKEIRAEAEAAGINWWRLRDAAKEGIGKRKDGFGGWWWWLT